MMVNGWKVTAIIFITLFVLETALYGWAIWYALEEEAKTTECYYDICLDYIDAYYEANMCYCYEEVSNELQIAKTEVMR